MDGYEVGEHLAFKHETIVTLYRATSLVRNNLPVVIKKHEFHFLNSTETQHRVTACLNAALSQAKVQHPGACEILEVQFLVDGSNCEVYHVLESLQTSVGRDIETGKRYSEWEIREFLLQTASVMDYAHKKVKSI